MTRYEWRDARPEDVGQTFPDARFSDIGDWSISCRGRTKLGGLPGRWRAHARGEEWKYARVFAPVEDDQTQAFDFNKPEGMALRDWFAGMAMQGCLSNGYLSSVMHELKAELQKQGMEAKAFEDKIEYPAYAQACWRMADAMMEARK